MARKRLNKKVALIGSTVLLLATMGAVVIMLRLSRDPAQFVADGDAAWAAKDYDAARRNYGRAYSYSRSPAEKIDLLFKMADVHREMEQWRKVLGCWEQVITSDPENLRARLGRLKYRYMFADSFSGTGEGVSAHWKEILSQTTGLIELASDRNLLAEPKARWEPSFGKAEEAGWDGGVKALGPYLFFAKGRAAFELARLGAAAVPEELLTEAQSSLQKARELDPNYVDVYRFMAEVYLQRAEDAKSRGDIAAHEEATGAAERVLAEAKAVAADDPAASISYLTHKLEQAGRGGAETVRAAMQALEPQYKALAERFPASAEAHAGLTRFYSFYSVYSRPNKGRDLLNQAIEEAQRAVALDKSSVMYARSAALLQYRRFSLYGDETALSNAIALTESALDLPDAQNTPGPRQVAKQVNRLALCSFLARCYVERIMASDDSGPARAEMLTQAERAVHEIEQIRGSGENPQVVMWKGMLELARGHTTQAVGSLYAAYEQMKAAGPVGESDAFLPYTLAPVFEGTAEIGAVIEFLGAALDAGIVHTKPEVLLDYAEALLQVWSPEGAFSAVHNFEARFGANARSQTLRIKTLIAGGHVTEAEEAVAGLRAEDPNTLRLRLALISAKAAQLQRAIRQEEPAGDGALPLESPGGEGDEAQGAARAMTDELRNYHRREADLMKRLLAADSGAVAESRLATLCEALVAQGDAAMAAGIVDAFLRHSPSSVTGLFYRSLLSEPDPSSAGADRRRQIQEQAIRRIEDPVRRATELGLFYQQNEQWDDAIAQWRQVLDATDSRDIPDERVDRKADLQNPRHVAASHAFDIARTREDWPLAEEIVALARKDNLDDCGGHFFAGRLAFARDQNKEALTHLDECLRQRPIFSYGYMFRGSVQAALENAHASVEDLTRAANLNPMDPLVAKVLAHALYARDNELGHSVSSEQRAETKRALQQAIRLNPRDTSLLIAYADYVAESEPLKALALRQTIQANAPSLHNAVKLGGLATEVALKEPEEERRRAFFTIAESAFAQAKEMEPDNQFMLENYAAYYRARGQEEKARQLLADSQDDQLLWRHYFRVGRYRQAQELLQRMYEQEASKVDALKGLVLVAEETGDRGGVKKYSEELLSLEDNQLNRLAQIRAYLDVGLVQEAQRNLQSFKEQHPGEPRILLMEALLAKRQGQLQRALELTNQNLERDEQNANTWRLRGEICVLMGDYDQAILDFRKSRLLEDEPATSVALAEAYIAAGRDEEAITELRRTLDKPGAPPQARSLLESMYRRLGRDEALRQLYAEVLGRFPDSVEWLSRAGRFAIDQGRYGKAEELYEKAYRLKQEGSLDQEDAAAARGMEYTAVLDGYLHALVLVAGEPAAGAGLWFPEKLDKVLQVGAKYIDTAYAAVAFYHMAEAKKKLGDDSAAAEYCRNAVGKAWENERLAVEVLQRVYLLMGPEEVSRYCRERLDIDPDSLAANLTMFSLAQIERHYDDAVGYIDKCIELCDARTPRRIEYLLKKAQVLTVAHRQTADNTYLDKAIAVYESLLDKMPKNSSVLNNLAYLLAQSDRKLAEALRYAGMAIEQSPDNAVFLDTYGYVLHKNGRHSEAAQSLAAAIQQYEVAGTAPAEVYEHLGMVSEALGENTRALVAYRRAQEVGDGTMSDAARERLHAAVERLKP